jgi:hypothetical protein
MHNFVRFILVLGFAGSAMTLLAGGWAWWNEEDRRLRRLARRALGGVPDAAIIARGRDSAAAFRLTSAQVLVMRQGGARALLYPMHKLVGAELIVDGEVAARAVRDEPRRALDRISSEARRVTLRLIFDDAAHPDFDLELWLPEDALRRDARPPAAAIQEARGWLARAEAILRRPAPAAAPQTPQQPPPVARPRPEPAAAYEVDPEPEFDAAIDDDPPWDEAPEADQVAEPPPAPKPAKPRTRKITEDGEPIPPLDEPIQPYLL